MGMRNFMINKPGHPDITIKTFPDCWMGQKGSAEYSPHSPDETNFTVTGGGT